MVWIVYVIYIYVLNHYLGFDLWFFALVWLDIGVV